MMRVIRKQTVVRAGGVIEIQSPDLPAGAEADVTVKVQTGRTGPSGNLSQLIGSGTGLFEDVAAVDSYILGLRKEWPR